MQYVFSRPANFKVCIVDGLIGGGKGLVAPIVSAFSSVESWLFKPELENVLQLHSLGHLTDVACQAQLVSLTNLYAINLQLGRDLNTRHGDESGIFKQKSFFKYLFRSLNCKNTEQAVSNINAICPIIALMTHCCTSDAGSLFETFQNRLVYIRMNRHPCTEYMLQHIHRWVERWAANQPSESLLIPETNLGGVSHCVHPSYQSAHRYMKLPSCPKSIDIAIALLCVWQLGGNDLLDQKGSLASAVIEIPFEKIVFNPYPYISQLSESFACPIDNRVKRAMKQQRLPRTSLTDSPLVPSYKEYGLKIRDNSLEMEKKIGFDYALRQGASTSSLNTLSMLAEAYDKRYMDSM